MSPNPNASRETPGGVNVGHINAALVTEQRLSLLRAGFSPLPCTGKKVLMKEWTTLPEPTRHEIESWGRTAPAYLSTGIRTKHTPALDIDILDPVAAEAVERLVRERFEGQGQILVRFGLEPKRCIPFRTDALFSKIAAKFGEEEGGERLELLADGQQFIAFGIHKDTRRPYRWFGGEPGDVEREELPYLSEAEARALVNDATQILSSGFRLHPQFEVEREGREEDRKRR